MTERLILHPFTGAEARQVADVVRDGQEHWAADYPQIGEQVGARMFAQACEAGLDPRPFGGYEIRLAETGQAVGGIGFHGGPDENGAVEIGYGLSPSARGKGYAAEAVRRMIELAREQGVKTFTGNADLDNPASHRVMAAAGMELVRQDEKLVYFELPLS
ncbi:GNAT family N-acetyltransferase [Kitasatospora sp. MMS16-BH015]|uniref:GNAT family N-acetyltransferase n=1 Tax=Kitasatospora sp. MMS16-BH015 TaxID=2018025 RepID=UPI0020C552DA|nr:GNAT family N-acetyltransferase [Kitasatospora sp. MMS16-BH015]